MWTRSSTSWARSPARRPSHVAWPSPPCRSTMRRPSSSSSRRAPSATSAPRGSTRTGRRSSRFTAPRPRRGARRTARVSSSPAAACRSGRGCRSRRWMRSSRSSRNSRAARGRGRSRRSAARRRRPTSPCWRRSSSRSRPAARRVWGVDMNPSHRRIVVSLVAAATVLVVGTTRPAEGQPMPTGAAVMAWHVTIAPSWFDPSTAPPQITPFGMLYAIHDALVRPLPGQKMGPSLAESWTESPDGLTYEFKLRRGLKFHNGDPVTTEDVKFSFERYKGAGAKEFQTRVRAVEIVDPLTIRFRLGSPWPDFMTFYGTTATGAGIVVPKKYLTQVGDDGFRKHPIGAGPYKFVSHTAGVDVVLEAYTGYWRRVPNVKRLVMKSVPDNSTRLAMLKTGEADIAVALDGPEGLEVRRDSRLQLVSSRHASIFWLEFADQWDPKSPWHDKRLRQAVNLALDRKTTNEAARLGFCPPAGVIVPRVMDFALQVEPPPYDPQKAKQLLTEAGYPNGLDAGEYA